MYQFLFYVTFIDKLQDLSKLLSLEDEQALKKLS